MAEVWTRVRSSNVERVGWDDETQDVLIEFKGGRVYAYPNQGESVYQDLIVDPNPGQYVSRHLRNASVRRLS